MEELEKRVTKESEKNVFQRLLAKLGLEKNEDKAAVKQLLKNIKKNPMDAESYGELGLAYFRGQGIEQNTEEAFRLLKKSYGLGCKEVCTSLAVFYIEGHGVKIDLDEGIRLLNEALENGEDVALRMLGEVYYKDKRDYDKAYEYLKKSNEKVGDSLTKFDLGLCYKYGRGVEQNQQESFKLFKECADLGDKIGVQKVGECYMLGEGVARDEQEAIKWFKQGMEMGDMASFYSMGMAYLAGQGVEKNPEQAFKFFLEGAKYEGSDSTAGVLGRCYYQGIGTPVDYDKAYECFSRSAKVGDKISECMVGVCYDEGRGVAKDMFEATRIFKKLAKEGHADAQYYLGRAYAMGRGVPRDLKEARKWLVKSVQQENSAITLEALKLLKKMGY